MYIKNQIPTPAKVLLIGLALLALPVAARADDPVEVRRVPDTFTAGDRTIRVERFEPKAEGKYPAIVLLHAVDGVEGALGDCYRQQAELYARKRYVVLLVHYFNRSGLPAKELAALQESFRHYFNPAASRKPPDAQAMEQHFEAWVDTVSQAVRHAGSLPNVNADRIGLAGLSLGAVLALRTAARNEVKIAAVVELFGCLPQPLREQIQDMPPTLMIHGDLDERVPPREAYALQKILTSKKLPVEFKMYQRVGHVFEEADLRDFLDAHQRIEAFFKKHLQDAPSTRSGR